MSRKSALSFLAVVAAVSICVIAVFAWRITSVSLHAEVTYHTHLLVLDLIETYVTEQDGKWPNDWSALETIQPSRDYLDWEWPSNRREIEERIAVDFDVTAEQVAEMTPLSFSAVRPIGPTYGLGDGRVAGFIERVNEAVKHTTSEQRGNWSSRESWTK